MDWISFQKGTIVLLENELRWCTKFSNVFLLTATMMKKQKKILRLLCTKKERISVSLHNMYHNFR